MTEEAPEQLGSQRCQLQAQLALLDSENLAELLPRARLDVLSFAATGAALARHVLAIEEASRSLLDPLPPSDPIAFEDAHTVRESSLRATEQICQALGHICEWVMGAPSEEPQTARMIRTLLHNLNNTLVGITCYAELLVAETPHSDECYAALEIICQEGSAIARIVRERAALQRQLGELSAAEPDKALALEQEALELLLQALLVKAPVSAVNQAAGSPDQNAPALAALPLIERQVALEALRRIHSGRS